MSERQRLEQVIEAAIDDCISGISPRVIADYVLAAGFGALDSFAIGATADTQAPASGEVEPVMELDISEDRCFSPILIDATLSLPAGHYELYTHPPAKVPEGLTEKALELCRAVENEEEFPPAKFALRCLMLVNQIRKLAATPTPATTPEAEWIKCSERMPEHGQKVRSRGKDGREFETEYFCYDGQTPRFKLIGKVWHHDNVVEWTATPPQEQ